MARRVFVTGTDTEIGKTVLCGLLCSVWGAHYWKPIQSGTTNPTDSEVIAGWIGGQRVIPEAYRLSQPLSPHLSARLDGCRIRLDRIDLPRLSGPLVVEGAGGVFVPLNDHDLMIDLMIRLGLPVIVAARSGLGTINHTLLTLDRMKTGPLDVMGVVLIGALNPENVKAIERFGSAPVIGQIPWVDQFDDRVFGKIHAAHFSV